MRNSNVSKPSTRVQAWGFDMTQQHRDGLRGVILDHNTTFTLNEFCRACGADRSLIIEMVAEGVIEPEGSAREWHFHGDALVRARRAVRLLKDLGVNMPGAALALDLLDELDRLNGHRTTPWR